MGENSERSVSAMKLVEGQNQPNISPKWTKLQVNMEKGEDDQISEFSDCLLIEILSLLPSTKEAIRTGTLSKRWKHIWSLVPTLIFKYNDHDLPWSDFFSFVDKTLTQCCQMKLKRFEVYSNCNIRSGSQVNNWIRYALSRNVEELTLWLGYLLFENECLLDQIRFNGSCFTDLRLASCLFNPTWKISWKNLRSLLISYEKLDEALIANILSGSPLLETLVLRNCYGYRRLDITSKSLKNLVFAGYFPPGDLHHDDASSAGIIEINAPHILSLTIRRYLRLQKFLLANVSSLVEAYLNYRKLWRYEKTHNEEEEEMLKGFILNLRHVNELNIGFSCSEALYRLQDKGFVVPSNVSHDWLE